MGMIMFLCPQTGREISTDWPRLRAVQRSLPYIELLFESAKRRGKEIS
jgi:hypothetical protein